MADKRTIYSRANVMIANLPNGATLHMEALKKMILMQLSSNEKNLQKTISLMLQTGLIQSIDGERFIVHNGNV